MLYLLSNCKVLLDSFRDKYLDKTGFRYLPTFGRDQKIFKLLLEDIKFPILLEYLDLYFKTNQKFYSPVFFKANINQFAEQYRKLNPVQHKFVNNDKERYDTT